MLNSNESGSNETHSNNRDIKSCNIIYGYSDGCLEYYKDSPIILIEPRKHMIDILGKLKLEKDTILIKKVLIKNGLSGTILYHDKINDKYWFEGSDLSVYGTNCFNTTKQVVYTTSLLQLINQYKIQNIKNLVININISNIDDILQSLDQFNHIISYIKIKQYVECKLFNNFYKENKSDCEYILYTHKNLNVNLPHIGIYFNDLDSKMNIDKLTLLLKQYQMSLIITDKTLISECEQDTVKTFVCYPESIKILNKIHKDLKRSKTANDPFHVKIINNLETIFTTEIRDNTNDNISNVNINDINDDGINKEINKEIDKEIDKENDTDKRDVCINNLDIIIQFNHRYLESNNTLQIMYPLKNDVIYVNKMFDIIYATKDCMYMLYQIIKSKYFSDYLDDKKKDKPGLFKIMSKRYFYDYISKIFVIKTF